MKAFSGSAPRYIKYYSKNIHVCQLPTYILTKYSHKFSIIGKNLNIFAFVLVDKNRNRAKILLKLESYLRDYDQQAEDQRYS